MKLKDFVDLKMIQEIQDKFSDATGLAAIAVDADGNYITKGSNFTDFCMKYTRGSQEGLRRCVKCDTECTGTYFCHAGLMDFASDILINGVKVGAIIGGQVLPQAPNEEDFRQIARELGVDENAYLAALKKVPIRSEKTIRAAADMLGNIMNQLVNLEYLKAVSQKKVEVFNTEVKIALDASREVKSKTRDLQNVASMQNILAINASIEAGRAGQMGAGFSIVAKEMGELSKSSAQTYSEIQSLIDTVEKSVRHMSQAEL